jgi:glutamine amidotransferase
VSRVAIIDYGHGNANSIRCAFAKLGVDATYSHAPADVEAADYLVLPGVGHHKVAVESLETNQLVPVLRRAAFERNVPVLGICLGMQLMTRASEEGGAASLGWVDAETRKIVPHNRVAYKVPHVGWNTVHGSGGLTLMREIDLAEAPFYFCHSFAIDGVRDAKVCQFTYETDYVAVFEKDNLFGVQFHPEKSQEAGLAVLKNFLRAGA